MLTTKIPKVTEKEKLAEQSILTKWRKCIHLGIISNLLIVPTRPIIHLATHLGLKGNKIMDKRN